MKTKLFTPVAFILVLSLSACLMPTRVASFTTSTPEAATDTPTALPTPTESTPVIAPTATATATLEPAATSTPVVVEATQTLQPAEQGFVTAGPTVTLAVTATPTVPTITAWMDTNCREGPDPSYEIVGSLDVGDSAKVLGKSSPSGWWYIENPSLSWGKCWVWGTTTEVEGDTGALPFVSPPE